MFIFTIWVNIQKHWRMFCLMTAWLPGKITRMKFMSSSLELEIWNSGFVSVRETNFTVSVDLKLTLSVSLKASRRQQSQNIHYRVFQKKWSYSFCQCFSNIATVLNAWLTFYSSQLNFFAISYGWDVMSGNLSNSPFFEGGGLSADLRGKRASPTNHCFCQSSRVSALSYGIKISAVHCLVLSQSTRVTDGSQTDGRTELRLVRPPSHMLAR